MQSLKGFVMLIFFIIIFIIGMIGGFLVFLAMTEFKPVDIVDVEVLGEATKQLKENEDIKLMTYNVGYLSLDATQDFFMDGGKNAQPSTDSNVKKNLEGVNSIIKQVNPDICLLQEVDYCSKRSFYINQYDGIRNEFDGKSAYTTYHKCAFIPYPLENMIKDVDSGMVTLNKFESTVQRKALPLAYSWPMSMVMFKRCLQISRMDIENSDKQLVTINVHLEAYDDGGVREQQLNILKNIMEEEYEKGNYVIVGGDFNQTFPVVDENLYPVKDTSHFVAKQISKDFLEADWKYAVDSTNPTSRLLNEVYSGNYEDTQLYVIDGYILSPNIQLQSVQTLPNGFIFSDHHPVQLVVKLGQTIN